MIRLFADQPVSTGFVVGAFAGAPHLFLAEAASIALAAITLALIAGVYIGFAVTDGRKFQFTNEFAVAIGFALASLAGLLSLPSAIPAALIAHAIWDILYHRPSALLTQVLGWYRPFCAVVHIAIAAILLAVWSW